MKKKFKFMLLALAAIICLSSSAQLKIKGVYQQGRDNDGEMGGTYIGWNSALGIGISIVPQGIYQMEWDGTTFSQPVKEPAVNKADFYSGGQFTDNDKAQWANNFNLMYGNSGAGIKDGVITTIFSRSGEDIEDSERFAVRKWDAVTGNLLSGKNDYYSRDMCLESAGMCVNPKDGKMYGLFYLTAQDLPDEIVNDPDFFVDQEGDATSTDAGYCICSIDLETMVITPITPGLYYGNFVTFAINSEGRAFALTSGGTLPALNGNEDMKVYDIDGNLAGAQLYEFDLTTGLMLTIPVEEIDEETGEPYTANVNKYTHGTGYCSQANRQSACFSKANPNVMYWVGYVNSGKGYNDYGSFTNLSDKEWRTNGKYDTALYEVDITTGEATRLSLITNRYTFSALWVDEEVEEGLRGDVNGDKKVDIEDVNATINIILELNSQDDYPGNADLVEDGKIDVEDMNEIINIILGV